MRLRRRFRAHRDQKWATSPPKEIMVKQTPLILLQKGDANKSCWKLDFLRGKCKTGLSRLKTKDLAGVVRPNLPRTECFAAFKRRIKDGP